MKKMKGGALRPPAHGDLDDVAAREVAFEFGPGELGGFEIELGAQDVAGRGHV
jgi:hypothetical protein